jgi:drug/metabolite transporter (DMT)-like permease
MNPNVLYALLAAALFGASTPLAKLLLAEVPPQLLGGLLYLGSGLGLGLFRLVRDRGWKSSGMARGEWPWFLGAILFGGVLGPLALLWGLSSTAASTASLLLNLEAVLTAVIAWLFFKENADRRVVLGMAAIVAGGVVLSLQSGGTPASHGLGGLGIALACLCWAIDNNLTRKVSASDALFIASGKGLVAGCVNLGLAAGLGLTWPAVPMVLSALLVGLLGYGISLVLFVLALRGLGTARTGAYFSVAPFVGALIALLWLGETSSPQLWLAASLMALGVWLHLTEQHAHSHAHEAMEHEHPHTHDAHHQHTHAFAWEPGRPHTHAHAHSPMVHRHPHFPDIHHRHPH